MARTDIGWIISANVMSLISSNQHIGKIPPPHHRRAAVGEDIIDKLDGLIKQATEERSHFYVKSVAEEAKAEIERLRKNIMFLALTGRS